MKISNKDKIIALMKTKEKMDAPKTRKIKTCSKSRKK